ncbi:protein of unknown function [Trichlorobacter ammonificans]|uniref:Uncharacterized protein n=1 Tax=Trichlorobacter ammonificans TaxID=2916410 RepID=A0ABM9D897_9BACT|nr:protein of unknown function [Trichlorobacter ammonificans]
MGRALQDILRLRLAPALVSIHARPLGRALLGCDQLQDFYHIVSIHARPLGRALPPETKSVASVMVFQSTPALWDGRFPANGSRLLR